MSNAVLVGQRQEGQEEELPKLPLPEKLLPLEPGKPGFKGYGYVGGKHGITGEKAYEVASYIATLTKTLEGNEGLRREWEKRYGKEVVEKFIEAGKALGEERKRAKKESYRPGEAFTNATKALQELYNKAAEKEGWSFTVSGERWGQIPEDGIFGILTYNAMGKLMGQVGKDLGEEKLANIRGKSVEEVVEKLKEAQGVPEIKAEIKKVSASVLEKVAKEGYHVKHSHFVVKTTDPYGKVLAEEPLYLQPSNYGRSGEELRKHREFVRKLNNAIPNLFEGGMLFEDLVSFILSGKQSWEVPSKGGTYRVVIMKPIYSNGKLDHYAPMTEEEQREFVKANIVKYRTGAVNRAASLHKIFSKALEEGYAIVVQLPNGSRVEITPMGSKLASRAGEA